MAVTAHLGRQWRPSQRQGMISAPMTAGLPTVADLRRGGIITSYKVVAAIAAYMRDRLSAPIGSRVGTASTSLHL